MFGYSRSAANGRIASGENDQIWLPRNIRSGRVGVILLHGSGNPDGWMDPTNQPASQKLAAALASAGIPCISGAMGYQTWANDTAMSRIDAAWAVLAGKAPISTTKIALIGGSMGGALGARYSQLYPSKVAAFAGIIPLLDLKTFYADQANLAEIATAWGVTSPAALPSSADILTNATAATSVPAKFWYSGSDVLVKPAYVTNYAAVVNATAVNVGTNGHTDATVAQVPVADVGQFLAANGC